MVYGIYESKQRKVFWKQIRKRIIKDLKKQPDMYGSENNEFLEQIAGHKKVWQQKPEDRQRLFEILTSNISADDIESIRAEYRIKDRESCIRVYYSRISLMLKLGEFLPPEDSPNPIL